MNSTAIDLLFAGDLILDEPNPDHWLSGITPALKRGIAIGHLEVPHTGCDGEAAGDVPAPAADPEHLMALPRAGFHAMTLAGNHIADCGADGIRDTLAGLARARLAYTGAGETLAKALQPARLDYAGRRIALLSYNCVGPESAWATDTRAGCAYVRIETADGSPIAPSAPLVHANRSSLALMAADIAAVRATADFLIVALHKGIVHTPVKLAEYERPVAHAAIEAGADVVVAHHAHIVRGIEFHRGKPIFHGLGNGCVVTRALSPQQSHAARAAWARKRRALFGFEPDPAYELAPFHPEAVHGMLGVVRWQDSGVRTGFIPLFFEPPGRPTLATGGQAMRVIQYIERITVAAQLPSLRTHYDGDIVWLD